MKRALAGWVVVFLAVIGVVDGSRAETRYVVDVLVINLRATQDPRSETLRLLRTGEAFEVLEETDRYLKVRTPEGEEGWVAAQYTTAELPKAQVIAGLQQDLQRWQGRAVKAEEELARVSGELEAARTSHRAAAGDLERELEEAIRAREDTAARLQAAEREYAALLETSREAVAIAAERDRLQQEREALVAESESLRAANEGLTRKSAVLWFLAGAGVLLVGWLLGLVSRKKRGRFSIG